MDRESLFQKALVLAESKGWIRSSSDHGAAGVAASADDIRDDAAALVEERNNATRMTESETFYEEFMLDRFYNNFA